MDKFLQFCRFNLSNLTNFKKIYIVIGNESCDLDSVISAIVLAYIKYHELTSSTTQNDDDDMEVFVLPLLNVLREDLHLRREIVFWFEVLQFELDWLICRDEVDFDAINSLSEIYISLVDHNENNMITRLLPNGKFDEIIDHHKPLSSVDSIQSKCDPSKVQIDTGVGSCCSLIALRYFKSKIVNHKFNPGNPIETYDSQIALILYGPILLDTHCFSPITNRYNNKDCEAITNLENRMKHPSDAEPSLYDRNEVYQRLVSAKNSLENLSFEELLRKDMKMVESVADINLAICISAITGVLLTEMSLRDKFKNLKNFCNNPPKSAVFSESRPRVFSAIILLTIDNRIQNNLRRQLGIFCTNKHLMRTIATCLERSELELEPITALESLRIYNQNNLQATRKAVLPIISTILNGPGQSTDENAKLTNVNGDLLSSAPSSFVQQPDSYYGSFIDDSFVGEFVGDYPEVDENILVMDADGQNLVMMNPNDNSCISHPHEIEFDFDSFGPESIIYAGNDETQGKNGETKHETNNKNEDENEELKENIPKTDDDKTSNGEALDDSFKNDNLSMLNQNEPFVRTDTLNKSQRKKIVPHANIKNLVLVNDVTSPPTTEPSMTHPLSAVGNDTSNENSSQNNNNIINDPLGVSNGGNSLNDTFNTIRQPSMKKKVEVNYTMFISNDAKTTTDNAATIEPSNESQTKSNKSLDIEVKTDGDEENESLDWRPLSNSELRSIDLEVIEPYKKVISHGGHLKPTYGSGNGVECSSSAIILFAACYLPDRSRSDYNYVMDNLFLYVVSTLHNMVADDYILIYMHNGGGNVDSGNAPSTCSTVNNMPTFSWLKRCYQMIDRKLKKNLKGLYLVHPTFWLKTLIIMSKPFISAKFSRKLKFVRSLDELKSLIPIDDLSIPDEMKI